MKSSLNRLFFLHSLVITVWLVGTYFLFQNRENSHGAIFWDRIIYSAIVFAPVFMFHLCTIVSKKKTHAVKNILFLGYFLSVIFLFLVQTDYFVSGVFRYKWGIHTQAKLFHHLFLVYFFFFVLMGLIIMLQRFKEMPCSLEKDKLKYIFVAFLILFTIGPIAYLPAYNIGIYPFSYLSGLVFTVILFYAILKHRLFEIKIFFAHVFSLLVFSVLIVEAIFSSSRLELLLRIIFLVIVGILGFILVRSTVKEITQKEELTCLIQDKIALSHLLNHQIRSPLSNVKNYLWFFEKKDINEINPADRQKYIARVIGGVKQLSQTTHDLLKLLSLEESHVCAGADKVLLDELIKTTLLQYANKFKQKKLQTNFQVKGDDFALEANKRLILEVIKNLFDNVYHYSEPGEMEIVLEKLPRNIVFKISNPINLSAIGNPEEFLKNIQVCFKRGKNAETKNPEGTGLGIPIVKRIVERGGGKFEVGVSGSKFWVRVEL